MFGWVFHLRQVLLVLRLHLILETTLGVQIDIIKSLRFVMCKHSTSGWTIERALTQSKSFWQVWLKCSVNFWLLVIMFGLFNYDFMLTRKTSDQETTTVFKLQTTSANLLRQKLSAVDIHKTVAGVFLIGAIYANFHSNGLRKFQHKNSSRELINHWPNIGLNSQSLII